MNQKLPLLALLLCVAAAAYATDAQVYKWTDAGGVVHYSDAPPPADAKNVQIVRVNGANGTHAATQDTESAEKPADTVDAKPPQSPPETSMADTAANRAKACDMSRKNLELLQSKFAINVAGANGKPQELDDKGRQAQIADTNAQIALYCR